MKRHYKLLIYSLLPAAVMLSACQKDDTGAGYEGEDMAGTVMFSPVIAESANDTKGEMKTGTEYGTAPFMASAWTGTTNQFGYTKVMQFTHATGSGHTYWSTVDASDKVKEYMWKKDETKTFYAYSNLPSATGAATMANISSSSQTLAYDVTKVSTASAQTDILLGYYNGTGKTPAEVGKTGTDWVGHFAPINFRHPLSAIIFEKGSEGWTGTEKITEISIEGVYASGTCTDNGTFSWGSRTGSTAVSMSNSSGLPIVTDIIGETFFLIPQSLGASAITIKATLDLGGGTINNVSATLSSDEWKAGLFYTYTLNLDGAGQELSLSVNLADWGEINTDVEIESGSVMTFGDPSVDTWDDKDGGNIPYTD